MPRVYPSGPFRRSRFAHLNKLFTVQSIAPLAVPEMPFSGELARRLDQFGQDAAEIARVQECDRRAHRAVPGTRVDQPHARRADLRQRRAPAASSWCLRTSLAS